MTGYIPILLRMRNMVGNNLTIRMQRQKIDYKMLEQSLAFEIGFLIKKWKHFDVNYSLYLESEEINTVFGHPSVSAV